MDTEHLAWNRKWESSSGVKQRSTTGGVAQPVQIEMQCYRVSYQPARPELIVLEPKHLLPSHSHCVPPVRAPPTLRQHPPNTKPPPTQNLRYPRLLLPLFHPLLCPLHRRCLPPHHVTVSPCVNARKVYLAHLPAELRLPQAFQSRHPPHLCPLVPRCL